MRGASRQSVKKQSLDLEAKMENDYCVRDEKIESKCPEEDKESFQTFLDDTVRAGQLIKGHRHFRTWIGFVTLSRMVRMSLEQRLRSGRSKMM